MPTPQEIIVRHGLCWCGCGFFAPIATTTYSRRFHIKGESLRYISGHNFSRHPIVEEALPFKIEGIYCRLIPLTQGLWAIVDESDYRWLMQWAWCATYCPSTRGYYAIRAEVDSDGKHHTFKMHREILSLERDDQRNGDHKNKCGLDNRRKNLRPASREENAQNASVRKDNTSGYKGLNWHKRGQTWQVRVQAGKIRKHIGYFKEFEKALAALIAATKALHGEFASFD